MYIAFLILAMPDKQSAGNDEEKLKENLRANFMDRPKYMPAPLVNSGIGLI